MAPFAGAQIQAMSQRWAASPKGHPQGVPLQCDCLEAKSAFVSKTSYLKTRVVHLLMPMHEKTICRILTAHQLHPRYAVLDETLCQAAARRSRKKHHYLILTNNPQNDIYGLHIHDMHVPIAFLIRTGR